MSKFVVFCLSSLGAVTLLAGTAAAGAAGLWMYSAREECGPTSTSRHIEWVDGEMTEVPGGFGIVTEVIPAPVPADAIPADAIPADAAPADVTPAPLDRDEELTTLKAQLAAALQRIAELEADAEAAPASPEMPAPKRSGGDF